MGKEISIIIATYNAEKTLEKCLNSIVCQKNDNVELLIIDGGSKDKTVEIVEKYKGSVDYLVSEPDKGIYDAWNKGIAQAQGKWLMFVGADDELLPDAIATYIHVINNNPEIGSYDYICAHNDYIAFDGRLIKKIGTEPEWKKMKYYMSAAHVGSLHNKRNLFDEVGVYDLTYRICADYELLLRKREKLKYLFITDTIAKMKEGGMSMSLKAIIETYKIREKHKTLSLIINVVVLIKTILLYRLYKYHK